MENERKRTRFESTAPYVALSPSPSFENNRFASNNFFGFSSAVFEDPTGNIPWLSTLVPAKPVVTVKKTSFADNFAKSLKELWMSKEYSDFTIIAGGGEEPKQYKIHKNVLGTQSSLFAEVFKKLTGNKMTIDDFSSDAVESMLFFMYTGEIDDESFAMEIYAIADKYNVTGLKEIAENIILSNLNESKALEVFNLAHLHNSAVMKQKSFEQIKKLFPSGALKNDMMEKPEAVRGVVGARCEHKQKIQEAGEEFQKKMQKFTNV